MSRRLILALMVTVLTGPTFGKNPSHDDLAMSLDSETPSPVTDSIRQIEAVPLEVWANREHEADYFCAAALDMLCGRTPPDAAPTSRRNPPENNLLQAGGPEDLPVVNPDDTRGLQLDLPDVLEPVLPASIDDNVPEESSAIAAGFQAADSLRLTAQLAGTLNYDSP